MIPLHLRPPSAADRNFILDSWLESYRDVGENRHMTNEVYFAVTRPRVITLLSRGTVVVAANPEDDWQIYGWVCFEPGVLHYVYVKRPFRRARVGSSLVGLLDTGPRVATHTGGLWTAIRDAWGLRFDPRMGDSSWRCAKCEGGGFPFHARQCPLREA